ncbi:hypothetical protein BDP27DRAFT_1461922 [Rhodocollybia butyracea]|uniref:Uncharacterized protein n=1 Tax=Rhodocollybia butyracea TaxID=206335 RepID=A0A9P5U3F8_9AGAR|nr:hypothetical protein BDP27DRAFT_1461922 [Rhodocollybia butyracea]
MAKLDVSGVIGSCTRFIHAAQPAPGLILAPTVPGPLSHTYLSQFFLPTSQLQQLQLVPDPTLLVFPSAPTAPTTRYLHPYCIADDVNFGIKKWRQLSHADADSNAVLTLDPSGEKGHHNPGSTLPVPNPQASEPEPTSISEFPQPESLPNPLSESHLIPSLAQIQEEVNTLRRLESQLVINGGCSRPIGKIGVESSEDQVAVSAPGQKTEYHAEKMTIDRYGDLRRDSLAKKEERGEREDLHALRAPHTPCTWDARQNYIILLMAPQDFTANRQ